MLTQFISVVILAGAALFFNNGWLIPRVDLPAHLLGHPALFKKEFISEATRVELLELVKSFKSLPTNVEDLKYYKTLHEHIGEAVPFSGSCPHPLLVPNINRTLCTFPGRVDIGSHYIRSGGHEGLKETYESLVSRVLSFGVYLFDLSKYPPLAALFDSPNFQEGSRAVCPAGRTYLDPFQFNFIVNVPGQTVAHHVDGVYFWGATRFQFPQWLLAVMKFSGLFEEKFVHQVQTVAYLHNWTDEREGKFVYYTDNGVAKSMEPLPRSANVVDGSKVVHAATVYKRSAQMPYLKPVDKNSLDYLGDDKWVLRSNGQDKKHLSTDDLRISIVYRARCFRDKDEAERFKNQTDFLTLDSILATLKQDLVRRGVQPPSDPFQLGMVLLKTYTRYPLAPESNAAIPYNYCALPRLYPETASLISLVC